MMSIIGEAEEGPTTSELDAIRGDDCVGSVVEFKSVSPA
jgi:hypothetical protein